jgi:hypothetical protein
MNAVKKYREIKGRIFVVLDGREHVQLDGVEIDTVDLDSHEIHFIYDALPPEFDTVFPQDIFIIYQDGPGFFRAGKQGMMLILRGFVTKMKPYTPILMVSRVALGEGLWGTGTPHISKPEFRHMFSGIEEHIGASE